MTSSQLIKHLESIGWEISVETLELNKPVMNDNRDLPGKNSTLYHPI